MCNIALMQKYTDCKNENDCNLSKKIFKKSHEVKGLTFHFSPLLRFYFTIPQTLTLQ